MNLLWAGMMLAAIVYGALNGTIPEVTQAALDSAKEAVTLCITMLGILSFWMGLMQIAGAAGLIGKLTGCIRPALRWLFPRIPKGHPAMEQIAVNCIANECIIMGLNKERSGHNQKNRDDDAVDQTFSRSDPRRDTAAAGPGVGDTNHHTIIKNTTLSSGAEKYIILTNSARSDIR